MLVFFGAENAFKMWEALAVDREKRGWNFDFFRLFFAPSGWEFGMGEAPGCGNGGEMGKKWEFPFNWGFGEAPGRGNWGKIENFTRVLDGEKPPLEGKDKNGNFQI